MAERGRPTHYTQDVADKICARLSDGETLRQICQSDDMPPESTVREWVVADRQGFSAHYAKAREVGYQRMADELLEIADDGANDYMRRTGKDGKAAWVENGEAISRSRLRVDTRKWLLAKALPKLYGDKVQIGGADDLPAIRTEDVSAKELARRLAFLLVKGAKEDNA